jgi:phosphonate transport system substrate-binding protein
MDPRRRFGAQQKLSFGKRSRTLRLISGTALVLAALAAAPAEAGWREEIGTFRIGMVAQPGAGQTVLGLSRIKEAFAGVLSMPVEVLVARDLAALIDAQSNARIEYAVYPATAYAITSRLCGCVEPIAAAIGVDGSTGLRAVLVVRSGRAADMSKLSGVRIAIPPAGAVAGNLLAKEELAAGGIDLSASGAVLVETEGAAVAERMFVDGSVDAILGWEPAAPVGQSLDGTAARLVAAGIDAASLTVLWRSEPLRYGPHAIRLGLDPEVKAVLVPFLKGMRDVMPDVYELLETQHGGGFLPVSQQDYGTALDIVDHVAGAAPAQ